MEHKIQELDNKCFQFEVEHAEQEKALVEFQSLQSQVLAMTKPTVETAEQGINTDAVEEKPAVVEVVTTTPAPIIQQIQKIIKVSLPLPYGIHLSKSNHSIIYKKGSYTWLLLLVSLSFWLCL